MVTNTWLKEGMTVAVRDVTDAVRQSELYDYVRSGGRADRGR